jgi:hypothetical protein
LIYADARYLGRRYFAVVTFIGSLTFGKLPVGLHDFADIDVADDVAGIRVDRDRTARALPRHALHRRDQGVAIVIAAGLLKRLVNEVQAITGAERDEIRTKAVRLLDGPT